MELVDGTWKGEGQPAQGPCVFVKDLTSDFFLWRTGRGHPRVNHTTGCVELAVVERGSGPEKHAFFRSGQPVDASTKGPVDVATEAQPLGNWEVDSDSSDELADGGDE
jgi:hypothetical protein